MFAQVGRQPDAAPHARRITGNKETSMTVQSRRNVLKLIGAASLLPVATPSLARQGLNGRLRIAMQDLRTELDPLHSRSTALVSFRVLESIYDKLFGIDYENGGQLRPMLAESIETEDSVVFRVRLRQGVKFHDGEELTADDVSFTFGPERMLKKNAPGYGVGQITFPSMAEVKVIDRHTVEFVTKAPDPVFPKRLTSYGGGIVSKSAFLQTPDFDKWARSPVGAGPYRVVEAIENSHIRLEAHAEYWGGRPPLESIEFRAIREPAARVAGLRAGDFDIITTISPDQFESITADPRLEIVGGDTMSFRTLIYDSRTNEVLRDPRIRRALNLAIDREGMVKSIWHGRISIPRSHQHPAYGDLYNSDRPIPAYDPERAKQLLSEAGYNGEKIIFKSVGNYYTAELAETQIMTAMWNAVGLNVEIQIKENWSQIEDEQPRWINNSSDGTYYPDPAASFATRWGSKSAFQTSGYWTNERFNELETTLLTALDPSERRLAYQEMLDIFDQIDPPGTVLHSLAEFFGKRSDITWAPTPTGLLNFRPGAFKA
ncbi:ABC transporter substrate-binding protein [Sinorhizobium meliloti]|uniref:ABC transporter substrate-binding protein n=1 Tax=Rhizobium meliloti TaxID=382 RepID=UPI0001E4CDE6|nr:ABC transporter substrate-binding protein [Sinorhizobium meliloti]AEG58239.1 ABC-type transporter, periplasmic subunit [Sinorhizobium meliloti AK83]MDE4589239.1 ABC transporter substrate-binding protein [Sinorhizobium meliloti]SEJ60610.1 peptide/nickel transport system substrate-binding protein [Sinorhizobium meliloti]